MKGKLLRKIDDLYKEKKKLYNKAFSLKERYKELSQEYQPKIDQLEAQADNLANQFRSLYQQSQEAYANEEKELAKELSVKGHKVQDQCETLNRKIKSMIQELQVLHRKKEQTFLEANRVKKKIAEQKSKLKKTRSIKLKNFDKCETMSKLEIEEFLDQFPQTIFKEIKSFQFKTKFEKNSIKNGNIDPGTTRFDKKTGKAITKIYPHSLFANTKKEKRERLKKTISHEIGHTIFRRCLSQKRRTNWRHFSEDSIWKNEFISQTAKLSGEDDFCECFAFFKVEPKKLKEFPKRLKFIKKTYSRLENK